MGTKKIVVSTGKGKNYYKAELYDENGVSPCSSTSGLLTTPQDVVYELLEKFRCIDDWSEPTEQKIKCFLEEKAEIIILSYSDSYLRPAYCAEVGRYDKTTYRKFGAIAPTKEKAVTLLFVKFGKELGVEIIFEDGVRVDLE